MTGLSQCRDSVGLDHFSNRMSTEVEAGLESTLRKYASKLTLDPTTAHKKLSLSEGNSKVTRIAEEQPYPEHPDRFEYWSQVICREGLTGRCYWEAEWIGQEVRIGMTYKGICRKGLGYDCGLGHNDKSWSISCFDDYFNARHNMQTVSIPVPNPTSKRLGVYLDWSAGTLSFYSVCLHKLTHLHTFNSVFTGPLYPGFKIWYKDSSVSLCQLKPSLCVLEEAPQIDEM